MYRKACKFIIFNLKRFPSKLVPAEQALLTALVKQQEKKSAIIPRIIKVAFLPVICHRQAEGCNSTKVQKEIIS